MSLGIAGMGWITPLGAGVDFVWDRLLRGEEAHAEKIAGQCDGQPYSVFRVPDSALASLAPHPRLRRVSLISRFAAAAGCCWLLWLVERCSGSRPRCRRTSRTAV